MQQYALSLPLPPSFSFESFFVSACNEAAFRWVLAWPDWPGNALLLCGPRGAGKTHLSHIWQACTGAHRVQAAALAAEFLPTQALVVEDIEQVAAQETLLHLYNSCRENRLPLLLTAGAPPGQLPFDLPDLTSRLLALPLAPLHAPDDALLAGVLRKQFADRQLKVEEGVIHYLVARMERAPAKAQELAALLDERAIAEQKAITVPFVKRVLGY